MKILFSTLKEKRIILPIFFFFILQISSNAQCVLSDPYKQAEYDFAIELGELNPDIPRRWGTEWDRLKSGEVCDVCELNLPFYFQLACRDGYIATLFFRTFDQPETGVINIIPASIGNLSRLEAITIMDAKTFTGSSTLQIPENIGSLNHLNQLSLGGSGVDELPESISNLIKLESLDVGSNRLNSLPENIGNLINLTVLNLGNNNLSTLPKSIGSLTNLISLTLSSNEISCLPIEFSKLCFNNFRTFTLQFNPLNVGLSEYCTNPENFTCSNNGNGSTVPCGDITITSGNNQVTITGRAGVNYQMMQIINITDGAYAPTTICRGNCGNKQTVSGLSEGQYLIKVFNPDWSLACDLAFDTPIQVDEGGNLNCVLNDPYKQAEYDFAIELGESNPDIPRRWGAEWDRLKSGEVCDVCELSMPSNFQFICTDGYATALFFRTFDVPGEGVITYIPESIGSLTRLEGIIIRDNTIFNNAPLTNLPESIGNLINLVTVDFTAAGLTELPESFGNLVNLDNLEIRNNNLTKLPENIGNLSSLRRFNAPANQIETIPPSIGNLNTLTSLRLASNQISCLPIEFSNLCQNNFTTFDISSNPVNASRITFCADPESFACSNNGNGSTVPCGDITITSGNNQVTITGQEGVNYQMMQIIDITNGAYAPTTICRGNCGDKQTISGLSEGQYLVKVFNPDWSLACDLAFDTPIQVGGSSGCIDQDGDGICSSDDCNDFDRNYPKTPGTECDDGNPNTSDDVIQNDGCSCSGTPSSLGNVISCNNFEIRYDNSGIISVKNTALNGKLRSVYLQKINPKNGAYLGSPELICNEYCSNPEQFSTEPGVYFVQSFDAAYATCQTEPFVIGGTNSNRMLGFEVANKNRVVNLLWTDLEVENGDAYKIEKSKDGVNFETFKVMIVDDNSNGPKFFQIEDSNPLIGFSFYRLKLISHSEVYYSTIKRVHIDDIEDFGLFPNPASNEINISLSDFENKKIRILLMNQLGNILSESEFKTNNNRYKIDLNGFPNGIYSIWIFAEGKKPIGKRFIKSDGY